MSLNRFQKLLICLTLLVSLFSTEAFAQFTRGYQMTFGKNRVQYNDFLWTYYRFSNFDTYYYLGGQELAQYTGRIADKEIAEIEQLFDYRINGRFQFIIYNKLSDFKQSNLGLEGEEANTNTGGLTKIIGSKVLIYFDGDYRHLREQIRAGISQVMINQLMYGGSIKDRLQSAVLLNLPDWYIQGLISFVAKGWTIEDDNRMRDGINTGRYKKFNRLAGDEAIFAGQSLWNYIIETYGSSSVSNLIYMTRINRNIESGFVYVIGSPLKELSRNWLDYYQRNYLNEDLSRTTPMGKPIVTVKKANRVVSQVKVSPDGNQLAYVVNNLGKYKVYLFDIRTHKRTRLSKGGYKSTNQNIDNTFPVLAWHPTGRYVAAIKEKKGKVWLDYYTPGKRVKRETNKFFYFDKVLDFSYSSTGSEIVLTGIQKGQSDIYTFNPRTKTYLQLTKDRWDDANAKFVLNDRYVIFNSTRTEDSIKPTSFRQKEVVITSPTSDVYLYDYQNKSEKLIGITATPLISETMPMMVDSSHFSYLSDENGIVNRYIATLDSTVAFIDTTIHYRYIVNAKPATDYQRSILSQDVNTLNTRLAELYKNNNRFELYLNPLKNNTTTELLPLKKTILRFKLDKAPLPQVKQIKSTPAFTLPEPNKNKSAETKVVDSTKIDINNYSFQTDFPKRKNKNQESEKKLAPSVADTTNNKSNGAIIDATVKKITTPDSIAFQMPKQRNYEIAFAPGYLLTQLDNSLLNETYQSYTGGAVYFDPGLNALFKIGLNDLMDDYRIIGGMRLSGNLNSNEYYASFENLKKRVDEQISFYRQSREEVTELSYYKINTHELKYTTRYPFSDLASVRGSISYRNDRRVNLSTDITNLIEKNSSQKCGSVKAEYVYDNTINTGLNLYNGLRFKLFAEYYNQAEVSTKKLAVVGADFRYYLKIHRQLIWATRFATSTSFGNNKLVYYLGSTDNSFVPNNNFNYDIQIDQAQNYAFQAVATNLRGFVQNIRNGNSFALINSEIRFPIFQYLINKPIRSDLFRNFQIIGFGDIGTAWTGASPYSKNNALFKKDYNGNPISISVTKNVEPIVGGYGFGLRTRLLGYFMRADWAWGVDDGSVQPRLFYFSLGLDF